MKTGRNEPCPCGSGKKYKHCCLNKQASGSSLSQKLLIALLVLILVGGLIAVIGAFRTHEVGTGPGKVWSEEHQHWH